MSTVTGFNLGFTNGSMPWPYATAKLSCGHVASVELVPNRGRCTHCGIEMDMLKTGATYCACGRSSHTILTRRNPHVEADRLTKIGDEVACESCAREAAQLAWLQSIDPAEVHHARMRHDMYHFYRYDPASPSGFFLMGSAYPTPAVETWLAAQRVSPLSPTERA